MGLRDDMPRFAAHEGVWDGTYRHFDGAGKLVDEHRSRIICRFPDDGDTPYHQTNIFTWPDGRSEAKEFPASYREGRLWWDNDLLRGWAAELPMDESGRSLMLYWESVTEPGLFLYETVLLLSERRRTRTWHWIRDGDLAARAVIEERLVSRDWRAEDAKLKRAA